jgi:Domain of unknown function (DUF2341)
MKSIFNVAANVFAVNVWPRAASELVQRCIRTAFTVLALLGFGVSMQASAQPAGWSQIAAISITNNAATAETGYQLRMVIDTSAMAPNAADLRFGADSAGATLLDYWIESGAGTANTVVWVKLPALAASGTLTIYMFSGNPSASSASTLNVFDYTDEPTNSATNQVATGGAGGVTNSQRGFRFTPNEDVLLFRFGKREPNGTTRYVTLFNFATQAMVAQQQISGPAEQYSYADAAQPIWLTAGSQYILTLFQGPTDGYYFGTSSQINPKLSYGDMRYCNSCTENTFPTNVLTNYHYGYPDFQFRTKKALDPAPTYIVGVHTIGGTVSGLSGTGLVLSLSAGSTQTLNVSANGSFTFPSTAGTGQSYTVTVQTQPSGPSQTCTVANGSGTVASADITDVAVTCTTNTYTVGGTVSGLAGTGLALSLNSGAQTVNVAADGSFAFPTAIDSGTSYAVIVQTQPSAPTQTCSVASGSGTVVAANITDVAVTCTTNTYTVGGSVGGLTGAGLVLSLNSGAQTLNIAADGSFTFPTAINSGATYAVTVQTQPSSPTQNCTVSSGTGTIGSADVTSVIVNCAVNTYTVGGSVSGLAGSGFVLSLNSGAQTLNVAADGSFTFATAINSGASYAVTVQTQPSAPTQTCTVASGSGTVTSANIADVAVTCTTNTYTVGGSVAGLTGAGLVLSLNSGAQTLNIAADGSFTFPTALNSGANYVVTVQTQPSSPAQTCGVTSGAGVVGAANVSNVSITCSALVRNVTFSLPAGIVGTSPSVPSTVPDGQVLIFTINVAPGYQLISATGCGGTLNGNVYTTAAITSDCAISAQVVAVAAQTPEIVPTGVAGWLLLAMLAVVAFFAAQRRRLR